MPPSTRKRLLIAAVLILFSVGFYHTFSWIYFTESIGCFSGRDGMILRVERPFFASERFSLPNTKSYRVVEAWPTVLTPLFCDSDHPPVIPDYIQPWDGVTLRHRVSHGGYLTGTTSRRNLFGVKTSIGRATGHQYASDFPELFVPAPLAGPKAHAFVEFLRQKEAATSGTIASLRNCILNIPPSKNYYWYDLVKEFNSLQATPTIHAQSPQ